LDEILIADIAPKKASTFEDPFKYVPEPAGEPEEVPPQATEDQQDEKKPVEFRYLLGKE